ncbi:hypothetical protein EIM50_26350 [Pseudoxanthomonas sp. SGD-10]|nr:hypothetical protein EIM50_26350 [Pseudoxanthomonas sp. SGD-10]
MKSTVQGNINDDFTKNAQDVYNRWNIYSPLWASAQVEGNALVLRDKDPYDYAKAERVVETAKKVKLEFTVTPKQANDGVLHIEFTDHKGHAGARILFDKDGYIKSKVGYRNSNVQKYEPNQSYHIVATVDVSTRSYQLSVNGVERGTRLFFQPVSNISKVSFRTGEVRRFPDADTPTDQDFDVENPGKPVNEVSYGVSLFKAEKLK